MPIQPSGPESSVEHAPTRGRHAKPWTVWGRVVDFTHVLPPKTSAQTGDEASSYRPAQVQPLEGQEVRQGFYDGRDTPASGVEIVEGARVTSDVIDGVDMIYPRRWRIKLFLDHDHK